MKNYYELKQTTLMEMEIEGLVAKIQRLEKELAVKELETKQLKEQLKPFLDQIELRKELDRNNNTFNNHLSRTFSKLHL